MFSHFDKDIFISYIRANCDWVSYYLESFIPANILIIHLLAICQSILFYAPFIHSFYTIVLSFFFRYFFLALFFHLFFCGFFFTYFLISFRFSFPFRSFSLSLILSVFVDICFSSLLLFYIQAFVILMCFTHSCLFSFIFVSLFTFSFFRPFS